MNVVNHIIVQHEITDENGELVRWKTSRARDARALFVYETSGYNLIVTQIALGHNCLDALLPYLHRKSTVLPPRHSTWTLPRNPVSEPPPGRAHNPPLFIPPAQHPTPPRP